jgi:hypothetical protein
VLRSFATVVAILAAALLFVSTAIAGSGTTTPGVSPAASVYVEQIPTAKGSATANTPTVGTPSGGSSSGVGIGIAAAALIIAGGGAGVVLLRRHRLRGTKGLGGAGA